MDGKTIWLSPETKEKLDALRGKGETFDQVVLRLLRVYATICSVATILGPSHYLRSETPPGEDPVRKAALDRADLDLRTL